MTDNGPLLPEALMENEANFRLFFDSMTDIVVVSTPEGRLLFTNKAARDKLRYSEDELATMHVLDWHRPEDRNEAKAIFAEMLRGKRDYCPLPLMSKYGRTLPVETRVWFGKWNQKDCVFGICKDLSAQQEAQQCFERIFRRNPSPMALSSTLDYRFLDVNDAFLETTGYAREEVIGKTSADMGLVESPDKQDDAVKTIRAKGHIANHELQVRRKDGTLRDGLFSVEVINNQGRECFLTVMVDITERKEAEKELRESEQRYSDYITNTPYGVFVTDENGRYIEGNPAACSITGYSEQELLSMSITDLLCEDSREAGMARLKEVLESGQAVAEIPFRNKKGERRWWLVSAVKLSDSRMLGFCNDITDRKQVEDAIKESERKWRNVLIDTPQIGISLDPNARIIFANNHFLSLTGWKKEDVLGRNWFETFIPDDVREKVREIFSTIMQTGNTQGLSSFENEILTRSGERRYVSWSNVITKDPQGTIVDVTCLGIDMTEREKAEEALRDSESRYRLLADNASDVIWTMNMEQEYTYFSPSVKKLRGYTPEEAIQIPVEKTLTPESHEMAMQILMEEIALEHESGVDFDRRRIMELEQFCKDGSTIWTEVTTSFIRDQNGMPIGIYGIARNITERRNAERLIRESEEKYRSLVEGSLQGVVIAQDDPLRLIFANRTMSEITGFDKNELLEMGPEQLALLIHEDDRSRFFSNFRNRIAGKDTPSLDSYRIIKKNGDMSWVQTHSSRIEYLGRLSTLTVFVDISDLQKAEQEKAKLQDQLVQAQKMESIGRLAGGVAHDFNNILTGINGYAEMILEGLESGDPMWADMKEIKSAGERAAGLTAQLLAFSRKQIISPKVIRPNDIIERSRKMIGRIIGEDIDMQFKPARKLGRIKADPSQLDQILVNLSVNAKEAMPDGGKLIIETQNVHLSPEFCEPHEDAEPGDYVMLAVTDTGCGMDRETQLKIFEPFFSTKGRDQGTGLGLATVYGIVKQNKGLIKVYSEIDIGTTFKVYFPRVMEEADRLSKEKGTDLPKGTETVLLVEDEAMVRKLARKILERQGYEVIEMENGGSAYAYFDEHDDPVGLLLTDVVMPNMNGKTLFNKLKEKRPGLKAIFMSGYTENAIAHHGVLDEGTHFIQKPFTIETLARMVRKVLDEKE